MCHFNVGRVGTLAYNSFKWRSIRLFNSLPMHLRSISPCSVLRFKTQLDGGHPVMAWLPIRCS